ncbi:MAG: hypothetical protein WBF86_07415, partial [Mycobacterium sp.]
MTPVIGAVKAGGAAAAIVCRAAALRAVRAGTDLAAAGCAISASTVPAPTTRSAARAVPDTSVAAGEGATTTDAPRVAPKFNPAPGRTALTTDRADTSGG